MTLDLLRPFRGPPLHLGAVLLGREDLCATPVAYGSTSLSEPLTPIADQLPCDCVADVVGTDELSALFGEIPRLPCLDKAIEDGEADIVHNDHAQQPGFR